MNTREPFDKGRRTVLTSLGAAGIALAAGGLLGRQQAAAGTVTTAVYGGEGEDDCAPCRVCEDIVDVKNFGAIGDGLSHPLSEFYSTLTEAQGVYPHALALTDETDWAAIQAALNTGKNVYVPDGNYLINEPVAIRVNGQALYSEGMYTTTLTWNGNDPAKNMIELLSMRRDTGNLALARTGLRLAGFLLTSTLTAVMANVVWMEDGVFHSIVERLRIILPGRPSGAVIRTATGGGYSYVVGPVFRDITITGGVNASGLPIPVGFWAEGIIEGYFENVKVYSTEVGWRFGATTAEDSRNVADCTFVRCQSEIGNRGNATDAGVAVQFFLGVNMNFYGCKFTSGASYTVPNGQRVITFATSDGVMSRSVNFDCVQIWQINGSGPAIQFLSSALYRDVSFRNTTVLDCPGGILSIDPETDVNVGWETPTYMRVVPKKAEFRVRGVSFAASSIAAGAVQSVTLADIQFPRGVPFLVSYSGDLQGAILTGYRTSGSRNGTASIQNVSASSISLAAGRIRWREFADTDLKSETVVPFDPPGVAPGASYSADFPVPGAAMNDFVEVGSAIEATGGLRNLILKGYVSAPGTVTVRLTNLTAAAYDLPLRDLVICVLAPRFAAYNAVAAGPFDIPDGDGTEITVSVPGAAPGDFPVASCSEDVQGLIVGANVTAAGSVSVRLYNRTGGAVHLDAATWAVGVYKRYSAL